MRCYALIARRSGPGAFGRLSPLLSTVDDSTDRAVIGGRGLGSHYRLSFVTLFPKCWALIFDSNHIPYFCYPTPRMAVGGD